MIALLRQYPFGADKTVQISRAECFDKETQPEYSPRKKQNHRINQDIRFSLCLAVLVSNVLKISILP